jgi:BioD-like phosphotransacetylase family protein
MPTIFIAGPAASGKTSLAYGLLARLRDAGRSAAYCKPFSPTPDADADHAFASGVLAEALGIAVGPSPRPLDGDVAEAAASIAELRRQHDIVIVEAADGSPAAGLAAAVDARVVEVRVYAPEQDWGMVADEGAGHWGARLDWLVVNAVPPYRRDIVSEGEAESWAEVDALVIPESRVMLAPTVAQIGEHLDAVWTLEPVNADALVERFLIGGNIMDNGPTYYGRYDNQAVITRAQRPDIQLASMLPQTRCLVLTGPGEPTEYVKAEARERDIPLLQVFMPTIEAADALDRLMDAVTPHSLDKVRHYAALLQQHAAPDWLTG